MTSLKSSYLLETLPPDIIYWGLDFYTETLKQIQTSSPYLQTLFLTGQKNKRLQLYLSTRDAVEKRKINSMLWSETNSFSLFLFHRSNQHHQVHHKNHTLNAINHSCVCSLGDLEDFSFPFKSPNQQYSSRPAAFSNIIHIFVIVSWDVCLCGLTYDINLLRLMIVSLFWS